MNIPNILTTGRILLIPVVVYCFIVGAIGWAASLFIIACLTDILDGFIARRCDMVTEIGKLLDPIADKGMSTAVLICMAANGLMPWWVVLIILAKEIMMFLGGLTLYRRKVSFCANWYGKAATIVTAVCVLAILLSHNALPRSVLLPLQWAPVGAAVFSFIMYSRIYKKIKPERAADSAAG